jgi:hypothetical protein
LTSEYLPGKNYRIEGGQLFSRPYPLHKRYPRVLKYLIKKKRRHLFLNKAEETMFESRVLNAKRRHRDHNGKFTNKEIPLN